MLCFKTLTVLLALVLLTASANTSAQELQTREDPFSCVLETRPLSCFHLFYQMPDWTVEDTIPLRDTVKGDEGTSQEVLYYELFPEFKPNDGRLFWTSDDTSKVKILVTEDELPPWPVGVRAALRFVAPGRATICVEDNLGHLPRQCFIALVRARLDPLPNAMPPTSTRPFIRTAKR